MSEIKALLDANQNYTEGFGFGDLSIPPSRRLAILACMDARLTVEDFLGLKTGEAHIIRNAGGIATDDAIHSLIISHELLGTREFLVINHTDCGMLTFKDKELQKKLKGKYGRDASKIAFHAFPQLKGNVRNQVKRIKATPFLKGIPVHGFVYDVRTGGLEKVA